MSNDVGAAILTGGDSRRMGRDKALIDVAGRPLVAVVAEACRRAGLEPVFAIGGDEAAIGLTGVSWRPDLEPGEGPLAGILAAFEALDNDIVFVVSVDHPALASSSMAATVDALADRPDAHVAMPVTADGQRQHLHSAWRRSARTLVEEAFDEGERALKALLPRLDLIEVTGIDPATLIDVDTPDELMAWARDHPTDR